MWERSSIRISKRILVAAPDLVVVWKPARPDEAIERAGIPAYNYRHAALPDVSRTIREVGDRIGHAAEAEALIKKIDAQMTSIRQRVSGRSSRGRCWWSDGRSAP